MASLNKNPDAASPEHFILKLNAVELAILLDALECANHVWSEEDPEGNEAQDAEALLEDINQDLEPTVQLQAKA